MTYYYFVFYGRTPIAACLFKRDAKKIFKRKKKKALNPDKYSLQNAEGRIIS